MQQIHEKMDLINSDEETINVEVLDSLGIMMETCDSPLAPPTHLHKTIVKVPTVTWDDVGGLEKVRLELQETVQYPIDHPEKFIKYGMSVYCSMVLPVLVKPCLPRPSRTSVMPTSSVSRSVVRVFHVLLCLC